MFQSFIIEFIKNRRVHWGTVLCFIFEIIKSGSIMHSFILMVTLFLVFFIFCYVILFSAFDAPIKQKHRISEQYRKQ